MNWVQVLQIVMVLFQQAGPVLQAINALHNAINAAPGTPEHLEAIQQLNAAVQK